MKASTVAALERINREFYRRRAAEFSDTRSRPWPGWQRVLELVRRNLDSQRISILDLGCGNGRLLPELGRALGGDKQEVSYLGVDVSAPLLAIAARAGQADRAAALRVPRLVAADLVARPLAELEPAASFDLIFNFGLMHHVPSFGARRRLLAESAGRLRPGGVLAVSFWQFGDRERFRRRLVSWRAAADRVDPGDLEAGDCLLAWGDSGAVRYCHFANEAEAEALVEELELERLSSFREDGVSRDLNLYYVLRKRGHNT
ncbi:MAG: class I SAM-dependent methyltransferase [bacterium]|nr:class I SAM-dependent methyltransferase [bacterium]